MLKTKNLILCGVVILCAGHAVAGTIEELAQKNQQIMLLDADIAIAKRKAELETFTNPKNGSGPAVSTVPAAPSTPILTTSVPKQVRDSSGPREADDFVVNAIYGDVHSPSVEILYQNAKLTRKRGEVVAEGWTLAEISDASVTFTKAQKKGVLSVTKYLGAARSSRGVGRDAQGGSMNPTFPGGYSPGGSPMMNNQLPPPPAMGR